MRVLITAGNTRERIDDVRDWGNIFTGNTGFAIAKAVAQVAEVDLLTSNPTHLAEVAQGQLQTAHRVNGSSFKTHAELRGALSALMARNHYAAIFMTAAVADYRPAGAFAVVERRRTGDDGVEQWIVRNVQAAKVKSSVPEIAFLGRQTEKLVDLFRTEWGFKGLLVKFKLEVGIAREELIRIGRASRNASGADYLVANTLEMVSGADAGAYLLSEHGEEWLPRAALADRMARLAREHTSLR
jgi:phosphopantothenoylcysteine synthetase/decarboxylase